MIKKNLWIVALLAVTAFLFMGCPDNNGDLKNPLPPPPEASGDLEIDDPTEIGELIEVWDKTGGNATLTFDKNVLNFVIPAGGSPDNQGFLINFPADAKGAGYNSMDVTFSMKELTTIGAGKKAKLGFGFHYEGSGENDLKPYEDFEIHFSGTLGEKLTQKVAVPRLKNEFLVFKNNKYGDGSDAPINYKLEITKIVFVGGEAKPCCTDCDVETCKDCKDASCTDACGTGCCVVFKGDTTTKVELVAGKVVHTNPSFSLSGGTVVAADGTITMKENAVVFYNFPADTSTYKIADYDYIEITYNLSDAVTTSGGAGNLKARLMNYTNSAAYTGGNWVDWGAVGTGLTRNYQTWGDGGTGGFALSFNNNDKATDGCDSIKLKITKIEFSKGTRYTVEFYSPMTPANNSFSKIQVLQGNSIGDRLPKVSNPGWTNIGWVDAWEINTNAPTSTANTIVGSTAITSSLNIDNGVLKLFAKWMFIPLPDLTVEAPANNTLFEPTPGGNFVGTNTDMTRITIGGKQYWIVGDYRATGGAGSGTALGIETKLIASQADFDAIKTKHDLGYTRIYLDLAALSTNYALFTDLVITYDMIEVSTSEAESGEGSRGIQLKNNNGGSGGDNVAAALGTAAAGGYPWLEAGTDKVMTVKVAAIGTSTLSIVKNGQSNGKQGAMLFRVTKVELKR